jgi:hypothetical protein
MKTTRGSRFDPEMIGFVEAWHEIETEHALLSVIKAAGWLEDAIEFSIRVTLKENDGLNDNEIARFLEIRRELHSFKAKIEKGYELLLYNKSVKDDLIIVCNLRNEFAHSRKAINFDTPQIRDEIMLLKYLKSQRQKNHVRLVDSEDPKDVFLNTIRLLMIDITAGNEGSMAYARFSQKTIFM